MSKNKDEARGVVGPTNHFEVDMSKPGGRAFAAAVESVATRDHAAPAFSEFSLAEAMYGEWARHAYDAGGDPGWWHELSILETAAWVAVARRARTPKTEEFKGILDGVRWKK